LGLTLRQFGSPLSPSPPKLLTTLISFEAETPMVHIGFEYLNQFFMLGHEKKRRYGAGVNKLIFNLID